MSEALEPKMKELVGIAAAVAGHCQPCFAYHYKEALRLGVPEEAKAWPANAHGRERGPPRR